MSFHLAITLPLCDVDEPEYIIITCSPYFMFLTATLKESWQRPVTMTSCCAIMCQEGQATWRHRRKNMQVLYVPMAAVIVSPWVLKNEMPDNLCDVLDFAF